MRRRCRQRHDEAQRGKVARRLCELLLLGLRRNAVERDPPVLLVYATTRTKPPATAGSTAATPGRPVHFRDKYQATLPWQRDHPWVRVITVADTDVAATPPVPRPAALASANCRSVDPQDGQHDRYGNLLHFDTWGAGMGRHALTVVGRTLGELSAEVEMALGNWPPRIAGFDVTPDPELGEIWPG